MINLFTLALLALLGAGSIFALQHLNKNQKTVSITTATVLVVALLVLPLVLRLLNCGCYVDFPAKNLGWPILFATYTGSASHQQTSFSLVYFLFDIVYVYSIAIFVVYLYRLVSRRIK